MRCLPLGRRKSPPWRACRFSSSRLSEAGADQRWSPNLYLPPEGKPLWTFCYHSPLTIPYLKNKKQKKQHGLQLTAARLVSCTAAFMRHYMNLRRDWDAPWSIQSVCPSSCHVKDMSAFMRFESFWKKKVFLLVALFHVLPTPETASSSLILVFAHFRCLWWLEVYCQIEVRSILKL